MNIESQYQIQPITRSKTTVVFVNWFNSHIWNYFHSRIVNEDREFDQFKSESVYFFTMTFDRKLINRKKYELNLDWKDTSIENDQGNWLYRQICQRLFGRQFHRDVYLSLCPLAIIAEDFEHSRFGSHKPHDASNIHLHGIWAAHPELSPDFRAIVTDDNFKSYFLNCSYADNFRFDPYDSTKGGLGNMSSYATKGEVLKCLPTSYPEYPSLRIYPGRLFNDGGREYQMHRTYMTIDKKEQKLKYSNFDI